MLVMTVARLSRHDFNNDVGRGSSSQDLLGAISMIFRFERTWHKHFNSVKSR